MKKKIFMAIVTAALLAGCVTKVDETASENASVAPSAASETASSSQSETTSEYVFDVNGGTLKMDENMEDALNLLGKENSYYEEASCAGQGGLSKIYTYSDYEITTYEKDGKDLICYVDLKTDNVATPEGIDLSSSKDDVIKTYGSDYEERGASLEYTKGNSRLTFFFNDDNSIQQIEYSSVDAFA
ncbi:hypothetical protein [Lactimicrobium massiliense]|uniref:hypothetical protein n=1 Tax=Lactimicrobium massiliense TaxID=2161814 RepID=UPI000D5592FA|nr:hypothetical protein [Lactimicrobium massiliense]